jgi:hypothetical protein
MQGIISLYGNDKQVDEGKIREHGIAEPWRREP